MIDAGPEREKDDVHDLHADREFDPDIVARAAEAVELRDRDALVAIVDDLHEADVADILEQLSHDERAEAVRLLGGDLEPDVLHELDDDVRDDVVEAMDPADLAAAARELEVEEVVYLVEDLEDADKEVVLDALEPVDRMAVEQSLTFPEDTAGRDMRRDFVTAPPGWSVGQMIDAMRSDDDLPEEFHDVVLVDPAMRPVGVVSLSRIMGAGRERILSDLEREDMHVFVTSDDRETIARDFNKYHMPTGPVVDESSRLVGVILIEDALEALDEEVEEDLRLLAGVGDESLSDRIWETTRGRFPWLIVNLLTAVLASSVISQFDDVIARVVALAVLMPIVASMGGNAATQSMAVAVRAIATRDLTAANMWRIVWRETIVGLANGVGFAVLVAVLALVWFGDWRLGGVMAAAMVVNMLAAGLAGVLVPISLDRAGVDPALASGTFVTTVTDVVGFASFLGLATLVLL